MTEQEIIEGNKLIMNSTFVADHHKAWIEKLIKFEGKPDTAYENAKYHSSWDWIMPVVEKIESSADQETGHITVIIQCQQCEILQYDFQRRATCSNSLIPKIEVVWNAVVDFIHWYNTHPTT